MFIETNISALPCNTLSCIMYMTCNYSFLFFKFSTAAVNKYHDKFLINKQIHLAFEPLALTEFQSHRYYTPDRRSVWNFVRLENEHLNNCGQFRAVRDINVRVISEDQKQDEVEVCGLFDNKNV